jgi:hypothetical protein
MAAALPVQAAFPWGSERFPGTTTWAEATTSWQHAHADLIAKYRAPYLAEVRRFAEELAPRFAGGEFHGMRDDELEDDQNGATAAVFKLEKLCAERFGVQVKKVPTGRNPWEYDHVGDEALANLIIAVSPSAEHWESSEWFHPGYCAAAVLSWDVIAMARALGLYVPTPDEEPSAEQLAWAREVLS